MAHPSTVKLKKTQQHTTGMLMLGQAHPLFGCNSCNMGNLKNKQEARQTPEKHTRKVNASIWTMVSLGDHNTCNAK